MTSVAQFFISDFFANIFVFFSFHLPFIHIYSYLCIYRVTSKAHITLTRKEILKTEKQEIL